MIANNAPLATARRLWWPAALAVIAAVLAGDSHAQPTSNNSNLWPVHRDEKSGFRISYPPDWIILPAKGRNTRFSVSPPKGSGNCNVVARPSTELAPLSQAQLNREIESLPTDQASWAEYIGIQPSEVKIIESRRARIHTVPAIVGTVETALENLEGRFTRKQVIAMTLTPGVIWTLNCGASTPLASDAQARFKELQPTFMKVFGSFAFVK